MKAGSSAWTRTLKRDLTASAEVLDALTPGFVAGDYRAAPIEKTCGLGGGHRRGT
jgi:hypothetical protein